VVGTHVRDRLAVGAHLLGEVAQRIGGELALLAVLAPLVREQREEHAGRDQREFGEPAGQGSAEQDPFETHGHDLRPAIEGHPGDCSRSTSPARHGSRHGFYIAACMGLQ
jgi:hypothetical protein